MWRLIVILLLLLAGAFVNGAAEACRGYMWERTFYFAEVPVGIEADMIAEVTIDEIVPAPRLALPGSVDEKYYQVALARVHCIVKGEIEKSVIKLANIPSSCGPYLDVRAVGWSGFVAGKMDRDRDGVPVLFATSESHVERERRLEKAGKP